MSSLTPHPVDEAPRPLYLVVERDRRGYPISEGLFVCGPCLRVRGWKTTRDRTVDRMETTAPCDICEAPRDLL